jgi:hypothetical protein
MTLRAYCAERVHGGGCPPEGLELRLEGGLGFGVDDLEFDVSHHQFMVINHQKPNAAQKRALFQHGFQEDLGDGEAVARERKAMLAVVSPRARERVLTKRLVSSVRRPG